VRVLGDVARALVFAHERGIVHRDIKPDNVLFSGGVAVVTDFGIAKALSVSRADPGGEGLTEVGTSLGTPAYMAPEQAAGETDVDHRADLYAFGCMAFEVLAGSPPFSGLTGQRLRAAHFNELPRPVSELRRDAPPRLAGLVMQCVEKDPSARPQTAAEVLEELSAMGGGLMGPELALATRRAMGRALAVYAAAFVAAAILARLAMIGLGLPDWVFPGALIVMGLGLPAILFTGLVRYQWAAARAMPTLTRGGSPRPRWRACWSGSACRWRRTAQWSNDRFCVHGRGNGSRALGIVRRRRCSLPE
jgi:hypothetical protein